MFLLCLICKWSFLKLWMDVKFCQMLFPYLLRLPWSFSFILWKRCEVSPQLICICWNTGLSSWHSWSRTHLPMQEIEEMWVWCLGWNIPMEEAMATHMESGFLPGESHGQRNLVGYSSNGCNEPDTTELT